MEASEIIDVVRKYTIVDRAPLAFDIEKSHNCYLCDRHSNSEYLDFLTFSAVNPIGFNHPAMHEPRFLEKLTKAALVKPNPVRFHTVELAEWVETFVRICGRDYFEHYFFIDVGALAVENALKTAFDWKVRKNLEKGLRSDLPMGIVHFKEAFHGRSGYTLSLTNTADPRKYEYFPRFDWPRITNPKCRFPLTGKNLENTIVQEKQALQEIHSVIKERGNELAAIIIEPIQCDGGDNYFRPEFFRALRKICDENELLFIIDEIQTGIGVTGKMWGYEHFGIIPDIICFCKKSQVGGIATTGRIDDVENVFRIPGRIGSTSGANLVDMVRATRVLQIIEEERLVEHAARMGEFLIEETQKLAFEYPNKIKNARGLGLLVAFDLPTKEEREEFVKRCFDRKLLIMMAEPKTIRIRPFLNVEEEDITRMVCILRDVLNEMEG
jgi:L-lysine 6-transaminase